MNQKLLSAIQDYSYWKEYFTRQNYFKGFRQYIETYGQLYMDTIRAANDEAALKALAIDILNALEENWAQQRFWKRSDKKYQDKLMLIQYLSPLLLSFEDPACTRFAELLRDEWAARRPKDAYEIATYKQLRRGFRNVIMGMEFRDKLLDMEEAEEAAEKDKK